VGEREAEPDGPANQVSQEKGPHRGSLGLDHRDVGIGPALQHAGQLMGYEYEEGNFANYFLE
jgi:hypothetical protein